MEHVARELALNALLETARTRLAQVSEKLQKAEKWDPKQRNLAKNVIVEMIRSASVPLSSLTSVKSGLTSALFPAPLDSDIDNLEDISEYDKEVAKEVVSLLPPKFQEQEEDSYGEDMQVTPLELAEVIAEEILALFKKYGLRDYSL